ncbi:MAG: pyridoxamine 5'-phosphate oxidase family protein [bacterium]|nr:pyridoxamine 5'-phosphate oxidase family protein [bacterium]
MDIQKEAKYQAAKFLKSNHIMVLASISENLEPEAATVYYVSDDDFNLFFMTSAKSRKAENLKINGKVAFVIGRGPEIITIQGGGVAKELPAREAETFYELIKTTALSNATQWPILKLAEEGYCTFKIEPSWMTYFNLDNKNHSDIASEEFYKII